LKDLKEIPDKDLSKILACIETLGKNPRQSSCKKLSGQEKYRLRYGNYRIIYSIQDSELTVWIVKIGHRKNVYD
jgi:mRNA interferase RelE/StbE